MRNKKSIFAAMLSGVLALTMMSACTTKNSNGNGEAIKFVTISGRDLISPQGQKLSICGTNLGNWLNPEGYMFGFNKTNPNI